MLGPWPGKAQGGTHAGEPLSGNLRDRGGTQERGGAEKKEETRGKEPRLQILKEGRMAQYLPAILPNPDPGASRDPCLPRWQRSGRGV